MPVVHLEREHLPDGGGALEGPWSQAFWFTVPGDVRSKSNHRRGDRTGGISTWRLVESYELTVKSTGRRYRPGGWDRGAQSDPVAARPKIVAYCFARSLLDVGNIDKSLLDALQGDVMVTDAQVCWAAAGGVRTSTETGVVVALARLERDATILEQAEAGCALVRAVTELLVPADLTTPARTRPRRR